MIRFSLSSVLVQKLACCMVVKYFHRQNSRCLPFICTAGLPPLHVNRLSVEIGEFIVNLLVHFLYLVNVLAPKVDQIRYFKNIILD